MHDIQFLNNDNNSLRMILCFHQEQFLYWVEHIKYIFIFVDSKYTSPPYLSTPKRSCT